MIKVNSKVTIKKLFRVDKESTKHFIEKLKKNEDLTPVDLPDSFMPPIMIVEELHYRAIVGLMPMCRMPKGKSYEPVVANCVWYNTKNELQQEIISLEILTEL